MTNREVMQQALAALESGLAFDTHSDVLQNLRAAMEQQAEPVAWQVMVEDEAVKEFPIKDMAHDWCVRQKLSGASYAYWIRPLYATPPQRQWVGLEAEEILDLFDRNNVYGSKWIEFARTVEAKLKAKNDH